MASEQDGRRTHRSTPDRPLTLNLSAAERETLVGGLIVAISEAEVSKDNEEAEVLKTILAKTVQEGYND